VKKVTVLLATFNGEKYIRDQLCSLLSQTGIDLHILCRDDRSVDGTFELLKKSSELNKNFRVVQNQRASGGASKNYYKLFKDCESINSDYFAFCDQDDIWSNDKLSRAVKVLEHSDSVGYSCSVNAFFENGSYRQLVQSPKTRRLDFLFEGAGQGCTFVMKGDFFRKAVKFVGDNESLIDDFHYHDWLVYLIARSNGFSWHFDVRPYVLYRQHKDNDTGARGTLNSYKTRFSLIKTGWYLRQLEIAVRIADLLPISTSKHYLEYIRLFKDKKASIYRRYFLFLCVIKYGRRRFIDRLVLAFACFMSYV